MPEANFGPEVAQSITPEMSILNQEGIVVVEPPQKPGFFKRVIKRGAPAVAGIALVLAACSGGDQNNDIRIDTQTPTPTAEATLESPPSPTSEPTLAPAVQPDGGGSDGKFPTTPTATSTPEVKSEEPTKVFPTVNNQGERVLYKKENTTYVCYNFDSRQPIYAPVSGNFSANLNESQPFAGVGISVYRADGAFQVTGNFEIRKDIGSSVEAGDLLGHTNVGVADKKSLGECDVVVTFLKSSATGNGTETDIDAIAKFFPGSISKPIREFTSQVEHKSGSGIVFLGPNPQ